MGSTTAKTVQEYVELLTGTEREIGSELTQIITRVLEEAKIKIWHGSP